ncbi:ExbD/TolR family protein [Paraliomyxa miuraensis]|uniref:ExbD/TolR family protein n=1 Tax=Paraliomyxa miuraensis TaxID=376150 RepID=UPI00225362CF|nr:biopolymer transporter ExbD [Paraliomyxa miuraensis]MCX4244079.1 biopolymer transporter ExbD [Paraliomyxa miuraensis]
MQGSFDRGSEGFREINVTPLVDVMLVLLIVFMVTAPLMHGGLTVELPQTEGTKAEPAPKAAVVTITRDARVWLGDEEVTAAVGEALAADPEAHGPGGLRVRADKDVTYERVAQVLAAARAVGIVQIDLVVEPADRGPG